MEIAPIPGIRAISPIQSSRTANDLAGVFRVEFQREQQETYTPHRQGSDRGLEDEDGDLAAGDEPVETELLHAADASKNATNQINFFA